MGFNDNPLLFMGRTRNHGYETGQISFATTGLTVAIPTKFTKIYSFNWTKMQSTGGIIENVYASHTVADAGTFTVTRETMPYTLSAAPADSYIASYNYVMAPIGHALQAGTITGMRVYHGTAFQGSPIMNLGKMDNTVVLSDTTGATNGFVVGEEVAQATSLARGVVIAWDDDAGAMTPGILTVRTLEGTWTGAEVTGATGAMTPDTHLPNAGDQDFFITDTNAWITSEVDHFLDIRSGDITVGASANEWASITVAERDLILFSTTGGTTGGPGGLHVEVDITPTAISALTFDYIVFGV